MIDNPGLATQQDGRRHIIGQLFAIFAKAAAVEDLAVFPISAREQLEEVGSTHPQQMRIVCDLIAGLTEQQAVDLHRRLTGIDFGSVLDRFR